MSWKDEALLSKTNIVNEWRDNIVQTVDQLEKSIHVDGIKQQLFYGTKDRLCIQG